MRSHSKDHGGDQQNEQHSALETITADAAKDIALDNPPILLGSPIGIYRGGQRECAVFLPAPSISVLMGHVGELAAELGADSATIVTGDPRPCDPGQPHGGMHLQLVAAAAEKPHVHASITTVAAGPTSVYEVRVREGFPHPLVDVDSFTTTYLHRGPTRRRQHPLPVVAQLENAGATVTPTTPGTAQLLQRSLQQRRMPERRRYDTDFADLVECSASSIAAARAEAEERGTCRPRLVLACKGDPVLAMAFPRSPLREYGSYVRLSMHELTPPMWYYLRCLRTLFPGSESPTSERLPPSSSLPTGDREPRLTPAENPFLCYLTNARQLRSCPS